MKEREGSELANSTVPNGQSGLDERLKDLIEQLAAQAPAEDITDADIDREVQAVRNAARPA